MQNFTYQNPTKIIFGKDTIGKLVKEIPAGATVLVTYGGGSIKVNGVYEQVSDALKGHEWHEFPGIEANPHYETCMRAVEFIRAHKIDFLLAVGGGSVIDATKFIAAATFYNGTGEAWDLLTKGESVKQALPFGVVLTLPATGSEMNSGAVITHAATHEKRVFGSPLVFPKFSILDPSVTFSLPKRQIANGVIDTFVHVMEQYCTYPVHGLLQDRFSEGILHTLLEDGPRALVEPENYDVRASLMWAATLGLNKLIACGVPMDWSTHMIGHELTALYGLDHAVTLAIVLPGVMDVMRDEKQAKILQMGERLFGITTGEPNERITRTISEVESFFKKMGVKTRLSDYGVGEEVIDSIISRFVSRGWKLGENLSVTPEKVREILKMRL